MDMDYNYEAGLERIEEILNAAVSVKDKVLIPKSDDDFNFSDAYYGWISSIFVDIRNSTKLFKDFGQVEISKVIRSFTSELIEILRSKDRWREIGIRGDCVYSIYATPTKQDIFEVAELAFWVNTFMKMLNKMFGRHSLPVLSVGIGVALGKELVVKAGRKGTGINDKVWIGEAVTYASKLSGMANKNGNWPILFSRLAYVNFIDELDSKNSGAKSWFTKKFDLNVGDYYMTDVVKTEFDKWIDKL